MTQCKLRIPATYYNDYGCYCGLGGAGTPVDGIDQCCMSHDNCYGKAMDTLGCPDIYTLPYSYTCSNHEPICNENQDACKNALCECDQAIVQCWLQYPVPEDKATCTSQKNPLESNKIS